MFALRCGRVRDTSAPPPGYELLDFGRGRRLERFGPFVLDRPAPAAEAVEISDAAAWRGATARYVRHSGGTGEWLPAGALPPAWEVNVAGLALDLRPTPSGGVGLFPEQLSVVPWLESEIGRRSARNDDGAPPEILNLFAHTGLLTIVAARGGARVVHLDASRPAVAWARRNAARSGMADRPIRWLVDDALAFARREVRRGRRYAGVVLDPPTYGHGPDGGRWRLESGIADLLEAVAGLTSDGSAFLLLTAHAAGLRPADLLGPVRAAFGREAARSAVSDRLELVASDGRRLPAGLALRWGLR
jgi:23S rRNA (cytosine1962-C5)-methyltransferase